MSKIRMSEVCWRYVRYVRVGNESVNEVERWYGI